MRKNIANRPKLIPLRRFAQNGLYSCSYLSLLVQRKKLKAEKIGRNYYTAELWFNEYLEQHAQNGKWEKYQERNGQKGQAAGKVKAEALPGMVSTNKFKYQTAVLTAAVFVLFVLAGMVFYFMNREEGTAAGAEERHFVTSTINVIDTGVEAGGAVIFGE